MSAQEASPWASAETPALPDREAQRIYWNERAEWFASIAGRSGYAQLP